MFSPPSFGDADVEESMFFGIKLANDWQGKSDSKSLAKRLEVGRFFVDGNWEPT